MDCKKLANLSKPYNFKSWFVLVNCVFKWVAVSEIKTISNLLPCASFHHAKNTAVQFLPYDVNGNSNSNRSIIGTFWCELNTFVILTTLHPNKDCAKHVLFTHWTSSVFIIAPLSMLQPKNSTRHRTKHGQQNAQNSSKRHQRWINDKRPGHGGGPSSSATPKVYQKSKECGTRRPSQVRVRTWSHSCIA